MIAYGELKSYKGKALVSGDKGIELKLHIIANDINANDIHALLHKPLKITIECLDETATKDQRNPQDTKCEDLSIMG